MENSRVCDLAATYNPSEGPTDSGVHMAIEMIQAQGMPVGKTTFETIVWIGRFVQAFGGDEDTYTRIYRREVKAELCNSQRANDANVRRALLDRFPRTGGGKEPAIGTKKQPGPLYGLSSHAISALAVGVTWEALYGQD
mgnify:CR=1 FL=1